MANTTTRNLGRLSEIAQVAVKHGFGYLLETHKLTDLVPWHQRMASVDGAGSQRGEHLREMLDELDQPIERLFLEFDQTPIAAASIGQVHRAVLPNGKPVAVKVQRPDAVRQIEADLTLLYQAARLAKERVRALDFIDAREIVDEFARSIRQELDYRLEARNAQAFHRNF